MAPRDSVNNVMSKFSDLRLATSDYQPRISETPYLDSRAPNSRLANFRRSELEIGKLVVRGRFTETREIRSVERDLRYRPASIGEEKGRYEIWNNTTTKGRANFLVKRVRKDLKCDREIERAALGLAIEANYLSRLNHQNILQLKGMVESTFKFGSEKIAYSAIITNRVTETLDQRIDYWNEQDNISLESDFILHLKTDYAFQVTDALAYLHDRRIVFRNLSLSSIGFTTSDTIQLMNFDCVKEIPEDQSYLQDGFKASQTYMSLEMYEGRKYDFKVDSYAWGICFYEMLTQRPAFQSTTNEEAIIREHGWRPSLEHAAFVPDGLLDLLEDSWETKPNDRFSIHDIRSQLEWILFGDGDDEGSKASASAQSANAADNAMEASNYFGMTDMSTSCLGLDIDESENFDLGGAGQVLNAAIGFSGTVQSFIPSSLLLGELDEDGEDHSNESFPQKAGQVPALIGPEEIMPRVEYTQQYRGLRLETIPPLSFVPPSAAHKHGRRRSITMEQRNSNRRGSLACAA